MVGGSEQIRMSFGVPRKGCWSTLAEGCWNMAGGLVMIQGVFFLILMVSKIRTGV